MTEIILADLAEWDEFADANRETIEAEYGTVDNALCHACQGGLSLGGGAAPAFNISFDM